MIVIVILMKRVKMLNEMGVVFGLFVNLWYSLYVIVILSLKGIVMFRVVMLKVIC